ncbi:MAG: energy transducer TonB [Syntrophales bacterium]|jgi:protein TonB|nr:energy transducer TonB [Syntrophales bacterium]
MTPQSKGFSWSAGIHGVIFAVFAALQISAASEQRPAAIDFILADKAAPAALQAPPPPAPKQKPPKPAKTVQPKRVVEKPAAPKREIVQAPPPPQPSDSADEIPAAPPVAEEATQSSLMAETGSASPAEGTIADADTAAVTGPVQGTAGNSDRGLAPETPEESRVTYLKEHFVYIRDRITRGIAYPQTARKMGWSGQVKIAFVVFEDGGVNDVNVVESSGFGLLDRNAVETVKRVAPFPRPPVRAEIRMAITYRLN